MSLASGMGRWVGSAAVASLLGSAAPLAATTELVPSRSAGRVQAMATLAAGGATPSPCLTPVVQSLRSERQRATAAVRRSLAALANDPALPGERTAFDLDGITARFTTDRTAFDRVDVVDDNANGRPDTVDEALSGIARAQRLLIGELELPNPGPVEIVFSRLGPGVDGLCLPSQGKQPRTHIWLDASARGGNSVIRRAAEHQYAHAVAAAAGLDPAWGEAFANWSALTLEGSPDERTLQVLADKLGKLGDGLVGGEPDFAGGNVAWLAFLDESYGPTAVKLTVEELGRGDSDTAALDRALRRGTGDTIESGLREFQLWSLLVGPRDDGKHFSFAGRLPAPVFAASAEALPALSVQADPEVGSLGAAAVVLHPGEHAGGLTIRFEGDVTARWGADLLVVRSDGSLQRVPMPLDAGDAGELSVPLQDIREALLLVRNLDGEGRAARPYSWAAQFEPGFPAEFGALQVERAGSEGGALVSWETSTERGLLGFNVLRARSDVAEAIRVNPVWIPSVGETSGPASYSFFDSDAEPGVSYRYRVEAVTLEGLTSRSEPVVLAPAP
jgi:hypothetical protein